MTSSPVMRRWLSMGVTAGAFAIALGILACNKADTVAPGRKPDPSPTPAAAKGARDWPLYGGTVSRNLVNLTDTGLPTEWNVKKGSEKNIKWSVSLGDLAYGGPVISGGKIFIGTNNEVPRNPDIKGDKGILMCFRESDGEFLWQAVHDKLAKGRVNDWPKEGICSSPVVEGTRLYYVSNRCEVICADTEGMADGNQGVTDEKYKGPKDVDVIWRLDMIGKLNVFPHNLATCSPLIVGDTLFVITSNGVDKDHRSIPAPDAPSFLAINKKTGEVLWQDKSPGLKIMHGQWSNPVYAEPHGKPMIIFPGGDGYLYSFDPKEGKLLWKFDCNPKSAVYVLGGSGTRSDFVSTPVVWEDKLYIGVGQDPEHKKGVGHLWCIDITKEPKNKDRDLSPVKDNFDPRAAVNKDSGLLWHYGGDNPAAGEDDRPYFFGRTLSTCAIHDGLLYTADYDGVFYCFNARTGKKHYEQDLNGDTWSSPYWVDGKIYIGNEAGVIHIFEHGKTKKLLKTVDMGGTIRATPVVTNSVLYVITENPCRLWAIKAK